MPKNTPPDGNIAPIDLQFPAGVALVQVRRRIEFGFRCQGQLIRAYSVMPLYQGTPHQL
jgi:hypothetical protein